MSLQDKVRESAVFSLIFAVTFSSFTLADQDKEATRQKEASGTAVLWRDPGNIAEKNLYWGSSSETRAPRPPFQFVKEDPRGTQPKIEVTDAGGEKWKVKFGEEVHAEVAATRLLWAFGYLVEETYFVPSGKIEGITSPGRVSRFVNSDGTFQKARFEKRPKNVTRTKINWSWSKSPFEGTKELSGLKILMTMINNWDTRSRSKNNTVLRVTNDDGTVEDWYVVEDLGSSFGKMGRFIHRNRWNLEDFKRQKFIDGIKGEMLDLHYEGGGSINLVPLDHARWFAALAAQLTERQVRQAFEAAGASREEIDGFSSRIMEKMEELQAAVGNRAVPTANTKSIV